MCVRVRAKGGLKPSQSVLRRDFQGRGNAMQQFLVGVPSITALKEELGEVVCCADDEYKAAINSIFIIHMIPLFPLTRPSLNLLQSQLG